jgi:hypothetical protein
MYPPSRQLREGLLRAAYLKSSMMALAAVVFALSACGADVGDACEFDSDCRGGTLCIEQTCYATCSDDSDCEAPYDDCHSHRRRTAAGEETIRACVEPDFDAPDDNGSPDCDSTGDCCDADAECVEQFGDDAAVCGVDGRCMIPVAAPSYAVLIRDHTQVDTAELPEDGGLGADIAAAMVLDRSGEPVGYAQTLQYSPANDADGPASALDGTAPALDADGRCVDGSFEDVAAPLGGQGGHLLVAFYDLAGRRIALNEGWQLVVIEWGDNCGASGDDEYRPYLCVAEADASSDEEPAIDIARDCTQPLTDGPVSGYQITGL